MCWPVRLVLAQILYHQPPEWEDNISISRYNEIMGQPTCFAFSTIATSKHILVSVPGQRWDVCFYFIFLILLGGELHPIDVCHGVSKSGECVIESSHCQPIAASWTNLHHYHQHHYFVQIWSLGYHSLSNTIYMTSIVFIWLIGWFGSPWTGRKQRHISSHQSQSRWSSTCNLFG